MNWSKTVMKYLDKTVNLVFLNLLWLVGSILGLGILGIFPATYALFILAKNQIISERFVSYRYVTGEFFRNYKKSFLKMNGLGAIYFSLFYFFWLDSQIVRQMGELGTFLYPLLLCFLLYTGLTLTYAFPVIIHSLGNYRQKAKLILCSPFLMPRQSLCSIFFFILVLFLGFRWSFLIPFCLSAAYITFLEKWIPYELTAKGLLISEDDQIKEHK